MNPPHAPGPNWLGKGTSLETNGFWFWCELYAERGITEQLEINIRVCAIENERKEEEKHTTFRHAEPVSFAPAITDMGYTSEDGQRDIE
jgi:hypothetical protein